MHIKLLKIATLYSKGNTTGFPPQIQKLESTRSGKHPLKKEQLGEAGKQEICTTNVPKIIDLKASSEQAFSEN